MMSVSPSVIAVAVSIVLVSILLRFLDRPLLQFPWMQELLGDTGVPKFINKRLWSYYRSAEKIFDALGNANWSIFSNSQCLSRCGHSMKLWTAEQLAVYNGTDDNLPILLGILGSVFDVTKGQTHYGPGGGYTHFAGRDASRAFITGNFTGDGLSDSLHDLTSAEVKGVVEWRGFYHRSYKFVGKLVGRYYDNHGNPTKYLKGIEAKAARGAQLMAKQQAEEAKLPSCNSRWSQHEGGEVWCNEGYPRLVQRPLEIAMTGTMSKRCACFKDDELDKPGLEIYSGCDRLSSVCPV